MDSRTKDYSAASFCEYITNKRKNGLGNYYAFTSQESYDAWVESLSEEELDELVAQSNETRKPH